MTDSEIIKRHIESGETATINNNNVKWMLYSVYSKANALEEKSVTILKSNDFIPPPATPFFPFCIKGGGFAYCWPTGQPIPENTREIRVKRCGGAGYQVIEFEYA